LKQVDLLKTKKEEHLATHESRGQVKGDKGENEKSCESWELSDS